MSDALWLIQVIKKKNKVSNVYLACSMLLTNGSYLKTWEILLLMTTKKYKNISFNWKCLLTNDYYNLKVN